MPSRIGMWDKIFIFVKKFVTINWSLDSTIYHLIWGFYISFSFGSLICHIECTYTIGLLMTMKSNTRIWHFIDRTMINTDPFIKSKMIWRNWSRFLSLWAVVTRYRIDKNQILFMKFVYTYTNVYFFTVKYDLCKISRRLSISNFFFIILLLPFERNCIILSFTWCVNLFYSKQLL